MANILLSAFACDPDFGSDEEVGWQWARQLAVRGHQVTVFTRTSHRNAIERHRDKTGECANVRFIYIDLPRIHALLAKINRRNHLYYYLWQWAAYRYAAHWIKTESIDLIHHVTWVSFRQPSFMGLLGKPFYFGPVAGGDEIPPGYASLFSTQQRIIENVRALLNALVRFDPLMRMTFNQARRVLFTSAGHLGRVPHDVAAKAQIELAIGWNTQSAPSLNELPAILHPYRLLFVGRCIGLKGMDLGLRSFAQALSQRPDLRLTIIGDGVDRPRWQRIAAELQIDHAIEWKGWLAKEEVLATYQQYDLLFYPSLRDSGGFVVLEALQAGLPVVCYKLGGPGVVVDESCGEAVVALTDQAATVNEFAAATLRILARLANDTELRGQCQQRVQAFTWDALISRIYSPIMQELGLSNEN
ncbi:glycosyltransferase family 4 protein [Chitinibacter sp. ZOR0017]|uniref:glycosyltransferase family 4 protein n=1 Tax=Chitinibacter sp. ZOR0017 TaxID=1339254 RepID=UPI000645C856|nr:glycosyltransferase family 4 protein [Chitinibacter sp. ZOR0017]